MTKKLAIENCREMQARLVLDVTYAANVVFHPEPAVGLAAFEKEIMDVDIFKDALEEAPER